MLFTTFLFINIINPILAIAVKKNIILNDIPLSRICPYSNCPGATLTVATATEKADTFPNMFSGISFCIKVSVNTLVIAIVSIMPNPPIAKSPASESLLIFISGSNIINITPISIGIYVYCIFFMENIFGLTLIKNPPIIIPKTQTASTIPYISDDSSKYILIKYGATIDNIGTRKIFHSA